LKTIRNERGEEVSGPSAKEKKRNKKKRTQKGCSRAKPSGVHKKKQETRKKRKKLGKKKGSQRGKGVHWGGPTRGAKSTANRGEIRTDQRAVPLQQEF